MKQATSSSELCAGLPQEFADYMNYVHDLRDEDQPDYQYLRKMFTKLFRRQGFEYDNVKPQSRSTSISINASPRSPAQPSRTWGKLEYN
jgi:hypothetical protein